MTTYKTIDEDITTMNVDCIVNAANERMLGGGGVDGAIHRAAGPKLREACHDFPAAIGAQDNRIRVPTGHVRITPAFKLPCKFVIHTAGPIWIGGAHNEAELLASCYRRSLQLAALYGLKSVAIPAISTGIFAYPIDQACAIAVREVESFIKNEASLDEIFLTTYMSDEVAACFESMGVPNAT